VSFLQILTIFKKNKSLSKNFLIERGVWVEMFTIILQQQDPYFKTINSSRVILQVEQLYQEDPKLILTTNLLMKLVGYLTFSLWKRPMPQLIILQVEIMFLSK